MQSAGKRKRSRKILEKSLGRKLTRYEVVHHKDRNINNNHIDNLVIMTLSSHSSHHMSRRILKETTKRKLQFASRKARPGAKLTIDDVRNMRKMIRDGILHWLIAKAFGIDKSTVSDIKCGESWGWLS